MLNITRRPHEAFVITTPDGTEIEVIVCSAQGNGVVLGINAPRAYVVDRFEVHYRKRQQAAGEPIEYPEPRGPGWAEHLARKAEREAADCVAP